MKPLYTAPISTKYGKKEISVYCCNILDFDEDIDILTTSAFIRSYAPTPGTMFDSLDQAGVSVEKLSRKPLIDLRELCNIWLSDTVLSSNGKIHRVGCIELIDYSQRHNSTTIEQAIINSIRAYFSMLDIMAVYDARMDTIALPLLGNGSQRVSADLVIVPLINECTSFLKRNPAVKRICFVEKNQRRAGYISDYIQSSYNVMVSNQETQANKTEEKHALAFISYSSEDKNIADNLCAKLEQRGVRAWYAPRDVRGPYAGAIANAINQATHFIVILSKNSMRSEHVLNEIDLAFKGLPNNIQFKPLRIDETIFTPSFEYYLSRQHWMDAVNPPLEERLNEFVDKLVSEL